LTCHPAAPDGWQSHLRRFAGSTIHSPIRSRACSARSSALWRGSSVGWRGSTDAILPTR